MSLTICAYVLLLTVLVASAAAAIEWGAQGRIPVRHLWSAAILIAMLAPPAALAWHAISRESIVAYRVATPSRVTTVAVSSGPTTMRRATTALSDSSQIAVLAHKPQWSVLAARISTSLTPVVIPLWICASAAFIAWLLIGALHWRRARRGWRSATIDGVQVEISPATGPAVLGVISHRIVMPAWAMSMPNEQRKLMLAHECEHVSARDPERLALAVIALVLMPWNAVLWWCAARLRRAIELDCDARVLRRYPGAKEYGNLLLDVASRGQGFGSTRTPSLALLHLPSELELRVRAMKRPHGAARRAIVAGAGMAIIAVAAAFTTPVPELPMFRSNVPKRDSVIAPQSSVMLHQVTVRVGRSQVTFDSATYSPKAHTINAGRSTISSLSLARADTDSTGIASRGAAVLRRKADSLRVLSAQLAARTHELDAVMTRLDSTNVALSVAVAQLKARGTARSLLANQLNYWDNGRTVVVNQRKFLENQRQFAWNEQKYVEQQQKFAKQAATFDELSRNRLPAAIARYYPNLAASVKPGMLLWFVVDSSGRVIRTALDTSLNRSTYFSADIVAKRFPGIASRDITSTSVLGKVIGDAGVTVVWAVDGKP